MPLTFEELTTYDNRRLEPLMASGAVPSASELVGYEFRGWNIQALTDVIGTRKFIKGFYAGTPPRPPPGDTTCPSSRTDGTSPGCSKLKNNEPIRYYFFKVLPGPDLADAIYPRTLAIDYRQWPKYSFFDPVRFTVDYLVYPDPANHDLLLGKSYAQLGTFVRPFLGFFILARLRPSDLSGAPTALELRR